MKNKKILIIPLMLLLALTFVTLASAAASSWFNMTLVDFTNSTTGTNNVSLIVSVAAEYNVSNVTCYYNASGGAQYPDYNLTRFNGVINTSVGQTSFTLTSTIASESSSLNLTCVLTNKSNSDGTLALAGGNNTISARGIIVDGTAPSLTLTRDLDRISSGDPIRLSWTLSDSRSTMQNYSIITTTPDSSKCPTIISTSSNAATSATTADDSLVEDQVWCTGTYNVTARATDYSGNFAITSTTFKVYSSGLSKTGSNTLGGVTDTKVPGFGLIAGRLFGSETGDGILQNKTVLFLIVIGIILYILKKKKKI